MNERVFIEAIKASAAVAAAAVGSSRPAPALPLLPGAAADLAGSAFNGVFNQIAAAIAKGHLDDEPLAE